MIAVTQKRYWLLFIQHIQVGPIAGNYSALCKNLEKI